MLAVNLCDLSFFPVFMAFQVVLEVMRTRIFSEVLVGAVLNSWQWQEKPDWMHFLKTAWHVDLDATAFRPFGKRFYISLTVSLICGRFGPLKRKRWSVDCNSAIRCDRRGELATVY